MQTFLKERQEHREHRQETIKIGKLCSHTGITVSLSHFEGKVQSLLPAGSLNSHTVLVLVNAIYFKGKWEKKFLEKNTSEMPFRISKVNSLSISLLSFVNMSITEKEILHLYFIHHCNTTYS